ncbi:MAG TPA: response regulator transcription factor [Candidatus Methylomirabilis sp.]|nr:response regulator transcription factor [Candidatus Methylomirabilis sp.]
MKRLRVLIVEDLGLVRAGILSILNQVEDIEVVGEASTGADGVRLAALVEPDVVLMDQDMPEIDGPEATRLIKEALPSVEIIVMTDRLDAVKALEAIEAGATGYVLKDIPAANLLAALRSVCNGRAFFHPEITRKLMDRLGRLTRDERSRQMEAEGLTSRELEILAELTKGSKDKQIAARFTVSEGTVKTHIGHILKKLGCQNRTQAVAYVLRKGLIR